MGAKNAVGGIVGFLIVFGIVAFFWNGGVGGLVYDLRDSGVEVARVSTNQADRGIYSSIYFFNDNGDYIKANGKVMIRLSAENIEDSSKLLKEFTFTKENFMTIPNENGVKETVYNTPFYNFLKDYDGFVEVETSIFLDDGTTWEGNNSFIQSIWVTP